MRTAKEDRLPVWWWLVGIIGAALGGTLMVAAIIALITFAGAQGC